MAVLALRHQGQQRSSDRRCNIFFSEWELLICKVSLGIICFCMNICKANPNRSECLLPPGDDSDLLINLY